MPMNSVERSLYRRVWLWLRWRGTLLVITFFLGLIAFELGTGVTDRSGLPQADIMTHVYYTLGLFVLGGLDLGMPTGGPIYARAMLWIAYFMAPIITASAVIESLVIAMRPQLWHLRYMKNHVVIAGCGRLSALCIERLFDTNTRSPILLLDQRNDHALAGVLHHDNIEFIQGDIASEPVLTRLRLDLASHVFLLTGDDFCNLDAATRIAQLYPHLTHNIVVHLADLSMVRVMDRMRLLGDAQTFNSHRIAATHLVHTQLLTHFARTEPRDVVILAGFGRFGQTVLDELQKRASGSFDRVIIMDLDAKRAAMSFDQDVGFGEDYTHELWDGNMKDPLIWQKLRNALIDVEAPVFVLGTGDDKANVTTALKLVERFPSAYVIARQFAHSPFVDHVAQEHGFETVSVSELLLKSMPETWFER